MVNGKYRKYKIILVVLFIYITDAKVVNPFFFSFGDNDYLDTYSLQHSLLQLGSRINRGHYVSSYVILIRFTVAKDAVKYQYLSWSETKTEIPSWNLMKLYELNIKFRTELSSLNIYSHLQLEAHILHLNYL